MGFTKLYTGILESTLWCESDRTRLVWVTMLAMADEFGRVLGSVPGLANRARVPVDDTRAALATFLAPDPDSRTPDYEGRRVEIIDGGWRLLNHAKYRELRSDDDRREQNRQAQQRLRERKKAAKASALVSTNQHESAESAHTYADADAKAEIDQPSSSSKKTRRRRKAADIPACPYEEILTLFSELLPELPQPVIADAKGRKKKTTEMWTWVLTSTKVDGSKRASTTAEGLEWIRRYFERARSNDFLMGRTPRGPGHETWKCTFDFLLTESGMQKVIEQTKVAA